MCNLYSMTRAPEAVRRLFRIGGNRTAAFEPTDAISPGSEAPVVRTAEDGDASSSSCVGALCCSRPSRRRVASRHQRARRQDPLERVLAQYGLLTKIAWRPRPELNRGTRICNCSFTPPAGSFWAGTVTVVAGIGFEPMTFRL